MIAISAILLPILLPLSSVAPGFLLVRRLRRLPQHEVAGVLLAVLVRAHSLAGAGPQLPAIELRQPPVFRKPGDGEVDRPILAQVRHLAIEQSLDQVDHRSEVLGGPWLLRRRLDPEPVSIFLEGARKRVDVRPEGHALVPRRGDGSVVHIGEVHDV